MSQGFKTIFSNYWKAYFRSLRQSLGMLFVSLFLGLLAITRNFEIGQLGLVIFLPLVPFTFVFPSHGILCEIIQERSSGAKEYLKLNGLGTFVHQLYLLTTLSIRLFVYSLGIAIPYAIGSAVTPRGGGFFTLRFNVDPLDMIQLYVLWAFATAPFLLCLGLMFSNPKTGPWFGTVVQIIVFLISCAVNMANVEIAQWVFSILPQGAFMHAVRRLSEWEPKQTGCIKLILVAQFFVYFALYSYLDQIVKNEHGISKSACFCCQRRKKHVNQEGLSTKLINEESVAVEDSSAIFNEKLQREKNQAANKVVQVHHLKNASFAIDDISFSITEGEIFCLLGEDKSGKSAIFKMLTGMKGLDSGEVLYDGEDLSENLEEIHKKISICLQNDILFEKLTVRENLEFLAEIRNIPFFDIPEAVDQALSSVSLGPESRVFADELLFREQKRKLGIAMAMIGQQKIILLDEPLAGLETQGRRTMWQYLRKLKEKGFTVFFTTNSLEEAGELGDRVALVSKGKLLAMGTPEYLKKELSVGYQLYITPVPEKLDAKRFGEQKEEIEKMVYGVIPSAKFEEGESTEGVLRYLLPFGSQKDFEKLFAELERRGNIKTSIVANNLKELSANIEKKVGQRVQTEIKINVE